jgi:cytochrome c553
MKRLLIVAICLICLVGISQAQIAGSPHDLSSVTGVGNDYYSTNQDQICIFCHTPHFASATQTPLWNRNDPATTYETYWSPTIDAYAVGDTPDVTGSSLICLSCHDGVTALNSLIYEGAVGTPVMNNGDNLITGTANLADGVNGLSNDHPVSFSYADAIANGDLGLNPVVGLPGWALDGAGTVQCASCHDVHAYGATADMQPFLNDSKTGSAICLQCHDK